MSHQYLPQQPSLASATGTRVDSACKHHHQCRVSTDDMLNMTFPRNNNLELQNNKYKYCVHKDELVLSVGRPWVPGGSRKITNNAYPRVISNLAMWDGTDENSSIPIKMLKYMYHCCSTLSDKGQIIESFRQLNPTGVEDEYFKTNPSSFLPYMCDFGCMGYAQTLGWAHPNNGDTMTTVMIGGLRTVMNGDFEVYTNDILQWYWPFEKDCFDVYGIRKDITFADDDGIVANYENRCPYDTEESFKLSKDAKSREAFADRSFGMPSGKTKMVPRIKPYMINELPRMYDKMRVFAIAISCARPHEMVDIKICRQSL